MHRLPRPHLVPLCLKTPAVRRFLSETYEALSAEDKVRADRFHTICEVRIARERPWRVMNQRRRLAACYWAGWVPDWMRPTRGLLRSPMGLRHGFVPPKWLVRSDAPRPAQIALEDTTSSEPGR